MTYGIKALRKLQFGRESTPGAAVAASTIWRGEGVLEDMRETVFPAEDIGKIPNTTRSYQPSLGASLSLTSIPATFEQIAHIFEMGIKSVTPVADGIGSGYVSTYDMPVASSSAVFVSPSSSTNAIKTYTIEGGDNAEAERMEFAYVTDFEISFRAGEAVMITANISGRQVSLNSFTGALSLPVVEELLASKGKLYIDAVGGTIGSTQITNEVLSGSLKITSGLQAVQTADGSLYFSFIKGVKPDVSMSLTFEHSTFAQAEKVFWRAGTPRQFRIDFSGSALATAGAYSTKKLICDLAGSYEKISSLGDQDGDDIITLTVRGGYNETAALFSRFIVVNELSALP